MMPRGLERSARPRRCRGVMLLTVIFLMIVLGLLAALLTESLSGQHAGGVLSKLMRQGEYAAASGLEWGRARAVEDGICGTTQIAVAEFTVDVRCTALAITEGAAVYDVFDVDAVARHGVYGNPDFVSRRLSSRYSNR